VPARTGTPPTRRGTCARLQRRRPGTSGGRSSCGDCARTDAFVPSGISRSSCDLPASAGQWLPIASARCSCRGGAWPSKHKCRCVPATCNASRKLAASKLIARQCASIGRMPGSVACCAENSLLKFHKATRVAFRSARATQDVQAAGPGLHAELGSCFWSPLGRLPIYKHQ
jgi:hypothetical protein